MTQDTVLTLLAATVVVCTAVGYLLGALSASSKLADCGREIIGLEDERDALAHKAKVLALDNQDLRTQLDRLIDRDPRGRFVRKEPV